jgi:hypothetical protein
MLPLPKAAGAASLIVTVSFFGLVAALLSIAKGSSPAPVKIAVFVIFSGVVALAAWWMFRRLHAQVPRDEARAATIAFAVAAPFTMGMANPLSLLGASLAVPLGDAFAFPGAMLASAVIFSALNIAVVAFALWARATNLR